MVVTSGVDGIYPKGFTLGHVDAVEKSGPAYKRITIKPAVNFSSLETVLVVLTPTPIKQTGEAHWHILVRSRAIEKKTERSTAPTPTARGH